MDNNVGNRELNIEVALKEYEAIKAEISDSIKARNQILSFGLAIAALIVNGIVIIMEKGNYMPMVIFLALFLLPTLIIATLIVWLGELERMTRAGNYIFHMENRINEILRDRVLRWEHTRRKSKIKISYAYMAVIGIFLSIALLPVALWFIPEYKVISYGFLYSPIIILIFIMFFRFRYIKFIRTNNSVASNVPQ